ncbi:MAG: hypothetical protein JNL69_05640, partial [Bacteroidia bacterium]|nr:hypothetical protein [Bacteroidia bacterium]
YLFTGKERDKETELDYFEARFYDSDIGIFRQVDALADMTPHWTPYRYCFNNPIMMTDPTGNNEDNYYLDKDKNIVGHEENNEADKYYEENDKGDVKKTINGQERTFSQNANPGFSIVKLKTDMGNFKGHSAVGFDGKMYGFYPTDIGGDGNYGIAENGTPLVMQTQTNSEFNSKYPTANTFFLKVTNGEKGRLAAWLNVQGDAIAKGNGGVYGVITNNCTTNIGKALNFTFGQPILGNLIVKPSILNDKLLNDYQDNPYTRIIKTDIKDYGNNLTNTLH